MHNILKVSGWSKGWLVVIDQTKALYDQSQYYVADYSYPRHDYRAKLYLRLSLESLIDSSQIWHFYLFLSNWNLFSNNLAI